MAGGGGFGVSALVQNQGVPSSSQPLDGFFISGSSSSFMGPSSMVSFQDVCGATRSERLLFCTFDQDDDGDDDLDEYAHQPGKKRRLSMDQVRFLERSFEAENKLEPDRKIQLAKELSLQPRQVAIWFQNRRARWKTKQLEKDYDALQVSFTSLKTDYDNLLKEKEMLKAEVVHLADKLQLKAKQHEDSNPANMDHVLQLPPQDPVLDSASDGEAPQAQVQAHEQEDLSPTKSDEFDSGSPHYIDGGHSSFGDSSYVFEPDQSDISQDDADNLSKNLLPFAYVFPRIEDVEYPDPPSTSCNFGFPIEDHASWFWSY